MIPGLVFMADEMFCVFGATRAEGNLVWTGLTIFGLKITDLHLSGLRVSTLLDTIG